MGNSKNTNYARLLLIFSIAVIGLLIAMSITPTSGPWTDFGKAYEGLYKGYFNYGK